MHQPIQKNPLSAMASQPQARQLELTWLFNSSCSSEVRGDIAKEVY
jgi:hypothetical protein